MKFITVPVSGLIKMILTDDIKEVSEVDKDNSEVYMQDGRLLKVELPVETVHRKIVNSNWEYKAPK